MRSPRRDNRATAASMAQRSNGFFTRSLFALLAMVVIGVSTPSAALPLHDEDVSSVVDQASTFEQAVDPEEGDPIVSLPVAELVALPGTCTAPAPIQPGVGVDCAFDLLPGVDPEALLFAEATVAGTFASCLTESSPGAEARLVCPDLLKFSFEDGTFDVELFIAGETAPAAATITTTWGNPQDVSLIRSTSGESVVFDGRPLRYFSFLYEPVDGLFLTVRERSGSEIIETIELEAPPTFTSVESEVVPDLPVGRYRAWPCVGPTAETCVEQPGGQPFQIINGELEELIEGHNRPTADRINILFVSTGLERLFGEDQSRQLPDLAISMLTIGGPDGLDSGGNLLDDDTPASRLLWGPMAIEPLASNIDRFNFWYLPEELADEEAVLFGGLEPGGDEGFGLDNLHITSLYNDGNDFASDARLTSFDSFEPDVVPPSALLDFGDARVWVPQFDPFSGATTLAHEWGHGLFALRDEYYGFDGRPIAVGYPNCAPDISTAEEWWGRAVGDIDPFVEQVIDIQAARLEDAFFLNAELVERTTIEITAGGCYSDSGSTEVYRPSADSLMNTEVPVFGAVNRARVQEVLDRFSGRGPMASLDDLSLSCEGEDGFVRCRGELDTYLDKPLSTVAVNSDPCEFGTTRTSLTGEVLPVIVTCTTIAPPDEPVSLSFRGDFRTLDVVDLNPPPPAPTTTVPPPIVEDPLEEARAEEATADTEEPVGQAGNGRTLIIGGLLCAAAISLAFVERRRRSVEDALRDEEPQ